MAAIAACKRHASSTPTHGAPHLNSACRPQPDRVPPGKCCGVGQRQDARTPAVSGLLPPLPLPKIHAAAAAATAAAGATDSAAAYTRCRRWNLHPAHLLSLSSNHLVATCTPTRSSCKSCHRSSCSRGAATRIGGSLATSRQAGCVLAVGCALGTALAVVHLVRQLRLTTSLGDLMALTAHFRLSSWPHGSHACFPVRFHSFVQDVLMMPVVMSNASVRLRLQPGEYTGCARWQRDGRRLCYVGLQRQRGG